MQQESQQNIDLLHQNFLKEAIAEAKLALQQKEGDPFGAVIVKDGKIIAKGHNQIVLLKDVTAHGEVQAIRNACQVLNTWKLNGCILYSSCEPCVMCMTACFWAGIQEVHFCMSSQDLQDLYPHITKDYAQQQINKQGHERNTPFYQTQCQDLIAQAKNCFDSDKPLPTD